MRIPQIRGGVKHSSWQFVSTGRWSSGAYAVTAGEGGRVPAAPNKDAPRSIYDHTRGERTGEATALHTDDILLGRVHLRDTLCGSSLRRRPESRQVGASDRNRVWATCSRRCSGGFITLSYFHCGGKEGEDVKPVLDAARAVTMAPPGWTGSGTPSVRKRPPALPVGLLPKHVPVRHSQWQAHCAAADAGATGVRVQTGRMAPRRVDARMTAALVRCGPARQATSLKRRSRAQGIWRPCSDGPV